jgi:ABC-type amino acid transport substrate-binding protein
VFAPDHDASFKILAEGKADAFANDDIQLYGAIAVAQCRQRLPRGGRLPHVR